MQNQDSDFEDVVFDDPSETPKTAPAKAVPPGQHGGWRPGGGRPKGSKTTPQKQIEAKKFAKAAAREKLAKADMAELEFKIKSGEYISRQLVQEGSATAIAALAQTLRSLPDMLERKGLEPKFCAIAEATIRDVLLACSKSLKKMIQHEHQQQPE